MTTTMTTLFSRTDYLLALPIVLLTLFALGILLIDLLLPPEDKWVDALAATLGIAFATVGIIGTPMIWKFQVYGILRYLRGLQTQGSAGQFAFMNSMYVDHSRCTFGFCFSSARQSPFWFRCATWRLSASTTASTTPSSYFP